MSPELLTGLVVALGGAVAVVIKRVNLMEWMRGFRASEDRKEDRAEDAFEWTRSQLELAHAKREDDTETHRRSQESLRHSLETRISHLETALANKETLLQATAMRLALSDKQVAALQEERNALRQELTHTREMYSRIIAETFARRVGEEER